MRQKDPFPIKFFSFCLLAVSFVSAPITSHAYSEYSEYKTQLEDRSKFDFFGIDEFDDLNREELQKKHNRFLSLLLLTSSTGVVGIILGIIGIRLSENKSQSTENRRGNPGVIIANNMNDVGDCGDGGGSDGGGL
jgi:hypothetical protein